MSRGVGVLIVAGAILAIPAVAATRCKDDSICVDEIYDEGEIRLRARNLRDFPITYTVAVDARNYSIPGPNTRTRTLAGGESEVVLTLSQRGNAKGSYRYDFKWAVGDKEAKHNDELVYRLPYETNRSYRVLQGYGSRFSHTGRETYAVDFDMPIGTPVLAARAGRVAMLEESHTKGCWDDDCGDYANYIVIVHDDGTTGEYYHLHKDGALVGLGEHVERGQKIALSGNTGHTTMPHLHFAVYRPIEWGRTQSIAVRFDSADGIISSPRRGARYQAR